jgi:acetyl esterase/lipase
MRLDGVTNDDLTMSLVARNPPPEKQQLSLDPMAVFIQHAWAETSLLTRHHAARGDRSFSADPEALSSVGRYLVFCATQGLLVLVLATAVAFGQQMDPIAEWATNESYGASLHQNIVYGRAGGLDLRLDVITTGEPSPRPVVVYFHGGGWVEGDKEGVLLRTLPYLAWGMDVVNVEYRIASQALAPAAVEDGRCALHWVADHARDYGFDPNKIVVAGESAGGHIALMTGLLTPTAGFDDACEASPNDWQSTGPRSVHVAAIIDFFGLVSLPVFLRQTKADGDVLPMPRTFVLRWLGNAPNQRELAERLSPITWVSHDSPPVLIAHGDEDPYVPYSQALLLRDSLIHNSVENDLITIHGGHGASPPHAWTQQQNLAAHEAVYRFLAKVGVLKTQMAP